MQITLALDQNFFSLIDPKTGDISFSLSFIDPGPKEIDFDSLPKSSQQIIKTARYLRTIEIEGWEEEVIVETPTAVETEVTLPTEKPVAEELLALGVPKCTEAIANLAQEHQWDILEQMQELEKQGKNASRQPRKMVLSAIEKALRQGDNTLDRPYDSAVVESDFEKVDITFDKVEE